MTNKELELIRQLTEVEMTVAELRAENKILKDNAKALAELRKLKNALEKIKFCNDTINEVLGK